MGLDTTHDAWHGGYSSFHFWRTDIAAAAGYPTDYNADGAYYDLDWENVTMENLAGEWEETPEDILYVLLAHSDCDGVIKAEHLEPLAARLEELLPSLESEDAYAGMHWYSTRGRAETFIAGLRLAAEYGEDIEFQ